MATISATQPIRTITPPSSSHGVEPPSWFNIDNEKTNQTFKPTIINPNSRQSQSQQTNGVSKMIPETREVEPPQKPAFSEEDYLAIAPGRLSRKRSNISRGESDCEPYKTGPSTRVVSNGNKKGAKRRVSNGIGSPEEDEENWIHRDKLAAIESRELEAAGFPVGRISRSGSRKADVELDHSKASANRESSLDIHPEGDEADDEDPYAKFPDAYPPRGENRQRLVSPLPPAEMDGGGDAAETRSIDFELRTPEEVAAAEVEHHEQYFRLPPPTRPNGSRLPLPRSSPVPVPIKIVERDSPLTRSHNGSAADGPPHLIQPRPISRSSQYMLDDEPPVTPTHATKMSISGSEYSPPKARVPKGAPTSGARKASGAKPRNSSQQNRESPQKRPGTSSGVGGGRPSTGHRPEGDPPWMATMYKPDPRLPPDQQILPTHARRLAQEQWEKEGKIGTIYDREFRLLNTEEFPNPDLLPPLEDPKNRKGSVPGDGIKTTLLNGNAHGNGSPWPLQTPPLGSPRSFGDRPGTSGTDHGGYNVMPSIKPSVNGTPVASPNKSGPPQNAVRVPEPLEVEKGEEKKGCGACCVVM
ncbi:hypothetical protein EJ08DRAFT_320244 [Tothia fuscella]|uniref:Uncharacterized protein n=1 Tax=Tothia fuscella TaxID=1048955 RepID=A0A9P4NNK1_9PEZI|nr:hypothetical protein EJ08DRAFT_320244 [Tothia fuscella]